MRLINTIAALAVTALFACNNSSTKEEESKTKIDSSKIKSDAPKPATDSPTTPKDNPVVADPSKNSMQVTAKFVKFELGDVEHNEFKDEAGKTWDFRYNDDSKYKFGIELPDSKSNTSNQGWGSNKALQGKTFVITYVLRAEKQYPDEPGGKVKAITHVEPK